MTIEVKVGQMWRDMDRRTRGRLRIVVDIQDGKALLADATTQRGTWVSLERFQGKPKSNGFDFVSEAPSAYSVSKLHKQLTEEATT